MKEEPELPSPRLLSSRETTLLRPCGPLLKGYQLRKFHQLPLGPTLSKLSGLLLSHRNAWVPSASGLADSRHWGRKRPSVRESVQAWKDVRGQTGLDRPGLQAEGARHPACPLSSNPPVAPPSQPRSPSLLISFQHWIESQEHLQGHHT